MTDTYYQIERFLGVWVTMTGKYRSIEEAKQRLEVKVKRDSNLCGRWRIAQMTHTPVWLADKEEGALCSTNG